MTSNESPTRYLSPHFALQEFLYPNAPEPPQDILDNLIKLAQALEKIRERFGRPIIITSGYRPDFHNRAVGGASNSYHKIGMAADIVVPGLSPQAVQKALADWPGGLGAYPAHTHVDIRPYKARWKSFASR